MAIVRGTGFPILTTPVYFAQRRSLYLSPWDADLFIFSTLYAHVPKKKAGNLVCECCFIIPLFFFSRQRIPLSIHCMVDNNKKKNVRYRASSHVVTNFRR